MKHLKFNAYLAFLLLIPFFCSCGLSKQARQASALAKCDFRIQSVEKVNLAGVDFQNVKSISDLGFADAAILIAGFTSPVFPLSMQVNLEGRNPNETEAGLYKLDWILYVDDIFMTSGIIDQPISIPPKSVAGIPVQVALDLKTILSGKSADVLMKFCMNLTGMGNEPIRLKIKLKPSILVGGSQITYPGYITVNTTFGSDE